MRPRPRLDAAFPRGSRPRRTRRLRIGAVALLAVGVAAIAGAAGPIPAIRGESRHGAAVAGAGPIPAIRGESRHGAAIAGAAGPIPAIRGESRDHAEIAPSPGLPTSFERNAGQAAAGVRFLAHGAGATLYLTSSEAVVALARGSARPGRDVLRMRLLGADRSPSIHAGGRRAGTVNYLVGDRSRWLRRVGTFARVTYHGVYRGIDLVYHARDRGLEYDFEVAPGADASRIDVELRGARSLRVDDRGRLHVRLAHRSLVQQAPRLYEQRGGARHAVSGHFVLRGARRVGFAVGRHDPSVPLVIDPVIAFSTQLGGGGNDVGTAIAADRAGNTYVAGSTSSSNLNLRRPLRAANHGRPIDAFVAKIDRRGRLVYATYLGASAYTDARGIAVGRHGEAYVAGATSSRDFPIRRAAQPDYGGGPYDAYVAELDASGSRLVYSTFVGGPRNDRAYAVAVDARGAAVATGRTAHDAFPAHGALRPGPEGGAFVTKVAPGGGRFAYSTVLGGSDPVNSSNTGFAVALDRDSNAYVTGITSARDFPTKAAVQPRYGGGRSNAFVAKIDARGRRLVYSTYLGGSGEDEGLGIAVRHARAYVTGQASSADFPAAGAMLAGRARGAGSDAFVAELDRRGSALVSCGRFGGAGEESGNAIAVDRRGDAFVAGRTTSPDLPAVDAVQPRLAGPSDAFLLALGGDGSLLRYATYLGGAGEDGANGVALDPAGNAHVTGQTSSPDFPVRRPIQRTPAKRPAGAGGGGAAFVTRIAPGRTPASSN